MGYYPIAIDIADKKCLIVGGGTIAARKAQSLLDVGARVTVISPQIDSNIEVMDVEIVRKKYEPGDVKDFAIVFAATNNRSVNTQISQEAQAAGILVNVIDDPELCSFIVPAIVRRGDLVISISTSGASPSLAKAIKHEIQDKYGPEYAEYVSILSEMRDKVKMAYSDSSEREAAYHRLLECGLLDLLREGRVGQARERAMRCIL